MECRLKELREKELLSQRDLAQSLGVSQQTISRVEEGRGEIPTELAIKAAKFFGISVEDFLGLSEKNENEEFLKGYLRLNPENQEIIRKMIQSLKTVQDTYPEE